MKKITLFSVGLVSLMVFGACSNNGKSKETTENNKKNKTEVTVATSSSAENNETYSSVFKDGKFTSNSYDVSIDKAELKHNNVSDYDVLVVTFTISNKLNENIVPQEIFEDLFIIKQQDETSEHQLFTEMAYQQEAAELLFSQYDIEGNPIDDKAYEINEAKQKEFNETIGNKLDADLLPGKEVQAVILVNVENNEYPVTFSLDENLPMKEKEDFVVNLK